MLILSPLPVARNPLLLFDRYSEYCFSIGIDGNFGDNSTFANGIAKVANFTSCNGFKCKDRPEGIRLVLFEYATGQDQASRMSSRLSLPARILPGLAVYAGTPTPTAIIGLLPAAWGEKNSVT